MDSASRIFSEVVSDGINKRVVSRRAEKAPSRQRGLGGPFESPFEIIHPANKFREIFGKMFSSRQPCLPAIDLKHLLQLRIKQCITLKSGVDNIHSVARVVILLDFCRNILT